jgi:hypothetical protein
MEGEMTDDVVEGGCFCGKVRYEARGRTENSMVCHCQSCRRVAGAPVVAWLTFPLERFRFTKGKPSQFHSSAAVTRTFCGGCGTPLTYRHDGRPESIDLTTATLDRPDTYPPTHHSWLSDNVAWVRFGDGLPSFQQSRPS